MDEKMELLQKAQEERDSWEALYRETAVVRDKHWKALQAALLQVSELNELLDAIVRQGADLCNCSEPVDGPHGEHCIEVELKARRNVAEKQKGVYNTHVPEEPGPGPGGAHEIRWTATDKRKCEHKEFRTRYGINGYKECKECGAHFS